MWNDLHNGLKTVENISFLFGKIALALIMLLITATALGRYIFGYSIPGAIPLIEMYLMIGAIFLAASKVQHVGGHVSTTVFARRIPSLYTSIGHVMANLATIGFLLMIIRGSADAAWSRWIDGASTVGALSIPTAYSYALVSLGLAILCLRLFQQSIRITIDGIIHREHNITPEDHEEYYEQAIND